MNLNGICSKSIYAQLYQRILTGGHLSFIYDKKQFGLQISGFAIWLLISQMCHAQDISFTLVADALSLGSDYYLRAPPGYEREGAGIFAAVTLPEDKSRELVVVGYGTMEPYDEEALPLRLIEFRPDGIGEDRTSQLIQGDLPVTEHPRQIVWGDFNEDGAEDIFVAAHGFDSPPFSGEPNVLLISQPDGKFRNQSSKLPSDSDFSHSAAVGDINGDEHLDIFVGNQLSGEFSSPYFLLGDGLGGFVRNLSWLPTIDPSWEEFKTFERNFASSYILDVNNDGHDDLILGANFSGASLVYLNDGSGDFSNVSPITLPEAVYGEENTVYLYFASLDVDRDGYQDLLISQTQSDYSGYVIQLLINNRDGSFRDESKQRLMGPYVASEGNWIVSLTLRDLNGDGNLDFFEFGNDKSAKEEIILWLNDGKGKFTPRTTQSVGLLQNPIKPAFVDFNHDGFLDLVDIYEIEFSVIGWDSYQQIPPLSSLQINVGHAGAWFNAATSGQGQLIDIEPENKFMFLSWFTYTDADSANPFEQSWFTAQGNYRGIKAELVVYETLDGRFDDPQTVNTDAVGTATLTFTDCGLGQMNYTIDTLGLSGSFPLQRAIQGSDNICQQQQTISTQAVDINGGMDGAWFDANTPGQGFLIDAHPNPDGGNFIFVAWFTYGDDTASGQRWLTAQGSFEGSTAAIDVYETTGGSFNDSQSVSTDKVGTMTIDFQDCSNALLSYKLTDEALSNSIAISRTIPGAQALCEELAAAD